MPVRGPPLCDSCTASTFPKAAFLTKPLPSQASATALRMSGVPAQDAGDVPSAWDTPKAHTRDPAPTTLDPNDPKAKQTHIPKSESFEEYMARRRAEGK